MIMRRSSLAASALAALLVAACGTVPITGRTQLQLIGERQELQLGLTAYRDTLKKEKLSGDPKLNEMIQRVGRRIAEATGKTDYQWEFRVIDSDKMVNAFALPGGKVAVYTGILPVTRDDAGLAAVIGHKVAHAIARHGGERMSQQLAVEGVVAATAIAVAERDPNKANLYAGLLGAGATVGVLLPYSRLQESEADRLGLIFMAKAGYDPRTAVEFWRRMAQAAKGKSKPPEFLSTHPADETRIRGIEKWMPEALTYYRPR
ncbi:MAG: M48 family metallopeptidase [Betaproteobacteria bacterium]|nr:M48 family metallopeptidase [Betaproteobacteria bacterium]